GEQVVAAQPLRLVAPAARAEGAEEISEVEADLLLVERPPRLLAPLLPLLVGARLLRIEAAAQRLLAELIVRITLFGIGEDVVGDRDLLELLLGLLVARVDVRVVLARELAVGLADLVRRGGARDAEDLVGILHGRTTR